MSNGVTRLRLNTETGEAFVGSGEVVSERPAEGIMPGDLKGVKPYASMAEFIADTQTAEYKGNPLDPRPGEAYRRNAELRLAAMDYANAMRDATNAPTDVAGQIVTAVPNINPAIVRHVVERVGGFISHEERANAYSDPRYKTSQDFRDSVAAREALTEF